MLPDVFREAADIRERFPRAWGGSAFAQERSRAALRAHRRGRARCLAEQRARARNGSNAAALPRPSGLTISASSRRQQTADSGAGVCATVGGIFKGVPAYTVCYCGWHSGSKTFRALLKRSNFEKYVRLFFFSSSLNAPFELVWKKAGFQGFLFLSCVLAGTKNPSKNPSIF